MNDLPKRFHLHLFIDYTVQINVKLAASEPTINNSLPCTPIWFDSTT